MNNGKSPSQIRCPIDLFPKQEREAMRLNEAINRASTTAEKSGPAQALIETVDVLLACAHYDENNADCGLCRNIAELRRKVAGLIISAGRL